MSALERVFGSGRKRPAAEVLGMVAQSSHRLPKEIENAVRELEAQEIANGRVHAMGIKVVGSVVMVGHQVLERVTEVGEEAAIRNPYKRAGHDRINQMAELAIQNRIAQAGRLTP